MNGLKLFGAPATGFMEIDSFEWAIPSDEELYTIAWYKDNIMKILIDEKAKNFLNKKNSNVITIDVKGCSSWSGVVLKPMASLGKPLNADKYTLENVDGIDVYVMNGINAVNDTVNVSTMSFLFIENLVVNGIIV